METPLPSDDRDLRAARRLDAGETAGDPLLEALAPLQGPPAPVDGATAERLWAGVEAEIRPAPRQGRERQDRAPARPLRRVRVRQTVWLAAATLAIVAVTALWLARQPAERLVAEAGATATTFSAPDGSTVELRPYSRLVRLRSDDRAYRLVGQAFFAVASDPDQPFRVETEHGRVRVLGTQFDVSTWGAQTTVFVEEGRVELSASGAAAVLSAGEAAASAAGAVVRDSAAVAATYLDWRDGVLRFESETADRVADELAQHLGRAVELPGDVAAERITGTLRLDEDPLSQLARVLGGTFQTGPDGEARFSR